MPTARPRNGTTALMLAAASGNADAVKLLIDGGADVNAKEPVRDLTAGDVRRGVEPRRRCSTLLAKQRRRPEGDVEGHRPRGAQQGSRGAARAHAWATRRLPASRRPADAAVRRPRRPRRRTRRTRGTQTAGVDRNYQLNELVAAQGGLTPLLLAAREGHIDAVQALLDAGADINQVSAGDQDQPAADRDDQRPLRSREAACSTRAPTRTRPRENNATPLYAALNVRVGAQGALSAAARAAATRRRPISS